MLGVTGVATGSTRIPYRTAHDRNQSLQQIMQNAQKP